MLDVWKDVSETPDYRLPALAGVGWAPDRYSCASVSWLCPLSPSLSSLLKCGPCPRGMAFQWYQLPEHPRGLSTLARPSSQQCMTPETPLGIDPPNCCFPGGLSVLPPSMGFGRGPKRRFRMVSGFLLPVDSPPKLRLSWYP